VNAAVVGGEMAAIDVERRGLNFVCGEERCGGRGLGRDDDREIGASTGFDSGAHGSPEKSTRQRGGCVHEAFTLTTGKQERAKSEEHE